MDAKRCLPMRCPPLSGNEFGTVSFCRHLAHDTCLQEAQPSCSPSYCNLPWIWKREVQRTSMILALCRCIAVKLPAIHALCFTIRYVPAKVFATTAPWLQHNRVSWSSWRGFCCFKYKCASRMVYTQSQAEREHRLSPSCPTTQGSIVQR